MSTNADVSPLSSPDRLLALRRSGLLDVSSEAAFDRLTRLAATALGAPQAYLTVITPERQLFKSTFGVAPEVRATPLELAICVHEVETGEALFLDDARDDPHFARHPAVVTGDVVAYAGVPLRTADGHVLGSLCVVDQVPRTWTDRDGELLAGLCASVQTEIGVRKELEDRRAAEAALEMVAAGTAACTDGAGFFESLAEHLARALGSRFAFVSALVRPGRARTLAYWVDGSLAPPIEYDLAGTPCQDVAMQGLCYFPERVHALYPHDRYLVDNGIECYMAMPVFDGSGLAVGMIGVMHGAPLARPDVASAILRIFAARVGAEMERLRADAALRESQEEWRSLAGSAPLGVFRADTNGAVIYVNERAEDIFGIARGAGLGHEWTQQLHPDDVVRVVTEWQSAVAASQAYATEYRLQGEVVRWVRCHSAPMFSGDGLVRGWVGTIEDVTEQRAMEEQLRHAMKMDAVGQLAGGMAHDFNNILTVVRIHADLAQGALDAEHPVADDIVQIGRAADRAANLTRQLLAFSRKQMMQPTVIDAATLLRDVAPMLRRLIGEDIELRVDVKPTDARVRADRGQIEQAIVNLAVNARDAMPGGGVLQLTVGDVLLRGVQTGSLAHLPHGHYVTVAVRDTGVGMSESTLARAFEPFYTTKTQGKGTGLGLSMVYGIARQSGGAVSMESAEGAGTTATIFLPVVEGPADDAAPRRTPRPRGANATILVVEDEAALRAVATRVLERHGFTVLQAATGREAVAIVEAHDGPFDLVLSDCVMPEMGGRALQEWMAVARPDIPVLLMTGYTDDEIIRRGARDADPDGRPTIIEKPFTGETLVAAVEAALRSR